MAANRIRIQVNTADTVKWVGSGGDELLTLTSLGAGAGRNGALHDWGASPRSYRYWFKMVIEWDSAPALGEVVRLYIREAGIEGSATNPTNDDGTGDVAVSAEVKLSNLMHVGTLLADEAAANIVTAIEGSLESGARFFAPTVWNGSAADVLDNVATTSFVEITPIPFEVE